MSFSLKSLRKLKSRTGIALKKIRRRSDMAVLWQSSFYAIQNGAIVDNDYVQSVNLSAVEVSAGNFEENGKTITAFELKDADGYKIKIRFKYRTYAGYGVHNVIVNGVEIGADENQFEWKEHTMYIDSTTCTVRVYVKNDSGEESWGANAGFQLLDVYLEA